MKARPRRVPPVEGTQTPNPTAEDTGGDTVAVHAASAALAAMRARFVAKNEPTGPLGFGSAETGTLRASTPTTLTRLTP